MSQKDSHPALAVVSMIEEPPEFIFENLMSLGSSRSQVGMMKHHELFTISVSYTKVKGTLPVPRDNHNCTTIGDKLFVFGGTDGSVPLKDLHILDTSTKTWMAPLDGPEAREGLHFLAKDFLSLEDLSIGTIVEEYFDDLYILNNAHISDIGGDYHPIKFMANRGTCEIGL
ncbi:Galactose oxidase/kelch, beta-propeller [Artemisia annua]|uniref:Galactose oxidase/kelch, beta-propeller n=1 Tax=Artemisia annua TaxID=35608 RepID=A0A2U1QF50_ARTAN|nr:Galactose oxidase/kelch, beta-propeller [Artemisia annua]